MSSWVSVKISSKEYKLFKVPIEVYVYIKQLENAIRYSDIDSIKKLYPERFKKISRKKIVERFIKHSESLDW